MRGQGGIQMLLTAEQEAQQIVFTARNKKMARQKQAQEEAEREVAAFRASLENEYQKKISHSSGSSGSNEKRLDEETEVKIKKLHDATSSIRSDVGCCGHAHEAHCHCLNLMQVCVIGLRIEKFLGHKIRVGEIG